MPLDTSHLGASDALKAIVDDLQTQRSFAGNDTPSFDAESNFDAAVSNNKVGSEGPADETSGPTASLGDIINALDERSFGLMILLLALPCCLPFIYLLPQLVALPMLALGAQLAAGRKSPWLPQKLRDRQLPLAPLQNTLERSEKYMKWFEKLARPRLLGLSSRTGARIVGAMMLVPSASILVPLPSTNTVPGIGVALTSLGLVERDGLLILAGLAIGLIWVFLLVFLGAEALSLFKDQVLSRI